MDKDTSKLEVVLREENILKFWKDKGIFQKSLHQSEGKKEFIFYEGPPTANGKPGIHHLEARAFKDAIPRYKTMRGYHVRRKGGWDTHGLPVELQIEKKLGLDSKKAIEEYGIAKFNKECKESVWEYLEYWNRFTERIGYWVDQENPYVTYHNNFIESVWNVIKEANKKNLLYKDYKVVPWCPRCGTALSSHELAQGYENVKDLSVYVKFRIIGGNNTFAGSLSPSTDGALPPRPLSPERSDGGRVDSSAYETPRQKHIATDFYILAWTTTPWTLPGNVALAVGKNIDYVKIEKDNQTLILAKNRLSVIDGEYKILEEFKGSDLVGLKYEPLYPFLENTISEGEKPKLGKAFQVYNADFVTTVDGTGVVHTAVMYGQDDFVLGNEIGLPKHHLVGLNGKFLAGTGFLKDRFVRDEEVTVDIIKDLAHRNLLLKKEKYEHSYPHCWRCKTALIYYARDSWYVKMSDKKIKSELIKENEDINWEPSHIKEGRFGEWLREIKDWAISRERYWGTPLPAWECASCKKIEIIGGIEELKQKTKKSGNKYFVMRHGESESNLTNKISSKIEDIDHLTEEGKKQVLSAVSELKNEKIDFIISSPFMRTRETAEIIKKELGLKDSELIFDKRIWELSTGVFDGGNWNDFWEVREKGEGYFYKPEGGESHKELKSRMTLFLYDIENKYKNKNILIITHEGPARIFFAGAKGLNDIETTEHLKNDIKHFKNAEIKKLDFIPIPHNEDFELDLHKPYIDEVELICDCEGKLTRTKEVMDVWFDSGAMPFAQDHYPSQNKKWVEGVGYPADFISEAIDQTRGWFYTLHAVGVIMGRGKAYKNVICLGHLLDAKGKKMSKSLGNVIDPWEMIEKYGVDTLRMWMYAVNQPGESKNFDEKTVMELHRQVFGLLYNVLAFYELYRDVSLEAEGYQLKNNSNILDKWIIAKLNELIKLSTESLDEYKLLEPVRAIRDFIGDLSTWYLRRSRERIKDGDKEAKKTLYFVLKNLVKIMAPFAPFAAEDIWLKLKKENDEESVHLANWPKVSESFLVKLFNKSKESTLINEIEIVRDVVSGGLKERQKAGIAVRQPLDFLRIKLTEDQKLSEEYLELIKDELNVKKINFDYVMKVETGKFELKLNTEITPELKEEGIYREFVRGVQDMRKKVGLTPSDKINMILETNEDGKNLIQKFEQDLIKVALISELSFDQNNGVEIKIGDLIFKVKIDK